MGTKAARVHHPLRNPFMIEMEDLFPKVEVLESCRTTRSDSQRILIVKDRNALLRRERHYLSARYLMALPASSNFLVVFGGLSRAIACFSHIGDLTQSPA